MENPQPPETSDELNMLRAMANRARLLLLHQTSGKSMDFFRFIDRPICKEMERNPESVTRVGPGRHDSG